MVAISDTSEITQTVMSSTEPATVCFDVLMSTYGKKMTAKDMEINKIAFMQMMDISIRARSASEHLLKEFDSDLKVNPHSETVQERDRLLESWYWMANTAAITTSQRYVFLSAYMDMIEKVMVNKIDISVVPKATIAMIVETAKAHGFGKKKWWHISSWF